MTIISRSALKLHDNVLTSTFRASFQFFHNADIGSITNRSEPASAPAYLSLRS